MKRSTVKLEVDNLRQRHLYIPSIGETERKNDRWRNKEELSPSPMHNFFPLLYIFTDVSLQSQSTVRLRYKTVRVNNIKHPKLLTAQNCSQRN